MISGTTIGIDEGGYYEFRQWLKCICVVGTCMCVERERERMRERERDEELDAYEVAVGIHDEVQGVGMSFRL